MNPCIRNDTIWPSVCNFRPRGLGGGGGGAFSTHTTPRKGERAPHHTYTMPHHMDIMGGAPAPAQEHPGSCS